MYTVYEALAGVETSFHFIRVSKGIRLDLDFNAGRISLKV